MLRLYFFLVCNTVVASLILWDATQNSTGKGRPAAQVRRRWLLSGLCNDRRRFADEINRVLSPLRHAHSPLHHRPYGYHAAALEPLVLSAVIQFGHVFTVCA